jgi:formamidopyrimidine-DNA glycosylase
MPELPEVETVVRGLKKEVINKKITRVTSSYQKIVKQSFSSFKKALAGQKISSISRHGKYSFLSLNNKKTIIVHLRMTGQLFITPTTQKKDKHTHLEIFFGSNKHKLIYRDIRKFGRFELIDTDKINTYLKEKKLGPDALTIKLNDFQDNLQKKNLILKAALLDQSVIAGLGNIYVDEVLIREKLSPLKMTQTLKPLKVKTMLSTIKKVLKEAILKKGTSYSDYVNSYGEKGKFQLHLRAYQQHGQPCYHCGTLINKMKTAGRGTHYCPKCQKL